MFLRSALKFLFLSAFAANLSHASEAPVTINFFEMKPDAKIESEIKSAVSQLLEVSRSNQLGIEKVEQFITKASVYGTKSSFDKLIESSPAWKAGSKVPATYVGFGEKKEFFIISWSAYQGIHPNESRTEYEKLLVHEISHLFHTAYLKGGDDRMGPVWFYEGFACFVANQYQDAVLPKDFAPIINAPERSSYRDYVAIVRELHKRHSIRELLNKAHEKDFNRWAIAALRQRDSR